MHTAPYPPPSVRNPLDLKKKHRVRDNILSLGGVISTVNGHSFISLNIKFFVIYILMECFRVSRLLLLVFLVASIAHQYVIEIFLQYMFREFAGIKIAICL